MNKRIICALLAAALMMSLSACAGPSAANTTASAGSAASSAAAATSAGAAEYVLKAGHCVPVDHPYQLGYEFMNKLLVERTGGKMRLEIYPNSQLGGERALFEGAQMGTVDLALGSTAPLVNFDKNFMIFDLPYLFDSNAHAYRCLDSAFGQEKFDSLEQFGMIGLAYWTAGWHPLLSSKGSMNTPKDAAGLNIRVVENEIFMEFMKAMGSNPVPMAFGEVFTAMQNGTVDACSVTIPSIYAAKLYTVAPYLNCVNAIYCPNPLVISKKTWDKLPAEYQKILKQAAVEARDFERDNLDNSEQAQVEKMKAEGTTVRVYTPEERKAWEQAFKAKVWDK